jgi:hypothetical protein
VQDEKIVLEGLLGDDSHYLFTPPPPLPHHLTSFCLSNPNPLWWIVTLLVLYLNLIYHLSHLACAIILKVLAIVLLSAAGGDEQKYPQMLNTIFKKTGLGVEDFHILPVCNKCSEVKPILKADWAVDETCNNCEEPLFCAKATLEQLSGVLPDNILEGAKKKKTKQPKGTPDVVPKVVFLFKSISDYLLELRNCWLEKVWRRLWRVGGTKPCQLTELCTGCLWTGVFARRSRERTDSRSLSKSIQRTAQ